MPPKMITGAKRAHFACHAAKPTPRALRVTFDCETQPWRFEISAETIHKAKPNIRPGITPATKSPEIDVSAVMP